MIKVLFIGDVCGQPGRKTVAKLLPNIKKQNKIDLVIANAENSAGGRGVTKKSMNELMNSGVDFFTSGDHIWRLKEFYEELRNPNTPIIRPANFPDDIALGKGFDIIDLGSKGKIAIINLQGWVNMRELVLDPLRYCDGILEKLKSEDLKGIIIDFHSETTSEKAILGHYFDGRVSAVIGTHTHVPTADPHKLPGGTAFISDVGMTGPRDSSLWVKKEIAIHNYKYPFKKAFKMETSGKMIFNSVLISIQSSTSGEIKRIDAELEKL